MMPSVFNKMQTKKVYYVIFMLLILLSFWKFWCHAYHTCWDVDLIRSLFVSLAIGCKLFVNATVFHHYVKYDAYRIPDQLWR